MTNATGHRSNDLVEAPPAQDDTDEEGGGRDQAGEVDLESESIADDELQLLSRFSRATSSSRSVCGSRSPISSKCSSIDGISARH